MDYRILEKQLDDLRESNPRKAAEVAYVLARLHLNSGDTERATNYGRESIWLFDQCRMETMEDCASQFVTLAGVALPSLIHQNVVRDRLRSLTL
jgi:hypothetical protein